VRCSILHDSMRTHQTMSTRYHEQFMHCSFRHSLLNCNFIRLNTPIFYISTQEVRFASTRTTSKPQGWSPVSTPSAMHDEMRSQFWSNQMFTTRWSNSWRETHWIWDDMVIDSHWWFK
jgi:hypothetical protein